MEAIATQVGGSTAGIAGFFFISKVLAWWYKRRVSGLVLLKGRTTLCSEMSNERLLFLDVDAYLEKMEEYKEAENNKGQMILLYTALKSKVDKMIRAYQKPVVMVSRHRDLLRVLGVPNKRIWFVCASQEAHQKAKLMYRDETQFAHDEAQRLRLLQTIKKNNVRVFEKLSDMKDIVRRIFKIENIEL